MASNGLTRLTEQPHYRRRHWPLQETSNCTINGCTSRRCLMSIIIASRESNTFSSCCCCGRCVDETTAKPTTPMMIRANFTDDCVPRRPSSQSDERRARSRLRSPWTPAWQRARLQRAHGLLLEPGWIIEQFEYSRKSNETVRTGKDYRKTWV